MERYFALSELESLIIFWPNNQIIETFLAGERIQSTFDSFLSHFFVARYDGQRSKHNFEYNYINLTI